MRENPEAHNIHRASMPERLFVFGRAARSGNHSRPSVWSACGAAACAACAACAAASLAPPPPYAATWAARSPCSSCRVPRMNVNSTGRLIAGASRYALAGWQSYLRQTARKSWAESRACFFCCRHAAPIAVALRKKTGTKKA